MKGKVKAVFFAKGFGIIRDSDGIERFFNIETDVIGLELPETNDDVDFSPAQGAKGKARATKIIPLKEQMLPSTKTEAAAQRIMNATKHLALIQAANPNAKDKMGFDSARYPLGLRLSFMWEDADFATIDRKHILKGSAYLLLCHRAQAQALGVTEADLKIFLPKAYFSSKEARHWLHSRISGSLNKIADRMLWDIHENPTRIAIAAVAGYRAQQHLKEIAKICGVSVESKKGSYHLLSIPENEISLLLDYAACNPSFRGLFPKGEKYDFDRLSLRFPRPEKYKNTSQQLTPMEPRNVPRSTATVHNKEVIVSETATAGVAPESKTSWWQKCVRLFSKWWLSRQ